MTITFPSEACAFTCIRKTYYCWSDNSKTKLEWKAFARTLLPF